jgi:cell division protein ZapA (FtsZ GTPase activity inhibitor)
MKNPTMQVKIGGKTVAVPIYRDEATTLRIVEKVNRRLQDIEEESPRIDSQAFALQTAFSFAADVARIESAADIEDQNLVRALSKLERALGETLRTLDGDTD